ncbi:MAG: hypothetical protein ABSB74_15985 [Tepidisphaeraceae bacterium]
MAAPSPTTDPSWLPAPTEPFWKPRLRDSLRYLRWRILLLALSLALAILILLNLRWARFAWAISLWKPIVMVVAIPILVFISAIGSALQARREPFCIHCGYSLQGLPDHYPCPECGRPNCRRLIDEYRRDPAWFIARCRARLTLPSTHVPFNAGPVRSRRRSRDGAS